MAGSPATLDGEMGVDAVGPQEGKGAVCVKQVLANSEAEGDLEFEIRRLPATSPDTGVAPPRIL